MGRHLQCLPDRIEEGHLHPGAQVVLPQQAAGFAADDACGDVVGDPGPGVVGDGLPPTDDAVVHGELANLDDAPVGQPVLHLAVGVGGEGYVEMGELYL